MGYFKRNNIIMGWLAFAVSLVVYILTMEPSASLWDCSEFIATSYKMEVGHPPGAPLFMMINRLFSMLAPDTSYVAVLINTASAVASALTIAFLFWSISHLAVRMMNKKFEELGKAQVWLVMASAFVGSLGYAFTDTFWFSAAEGEVYAQSSLFTAIVFWMILKWESVAEEPHSNRWLVLLAYVMGLSIGVHLLNLLAIPAIVFVYYYKHNPVRSKFGWWKALSISVVILAGVLYGIKPGMIAIGAFVDRLFVNGLGMPVNSGILLFVIAALAGLGYGVYRTHKKGKVVLNTILLCVSAIIIGYSSYASVIIRSSANPPMNSNHPSDPYTLKAFLDREQYGKSPLLYGPYYNAPQTETITKTTYFYNEDTKKYEPQEFIDVEYDSRFMTIFPRMYSPQHKTAYEQWAGVKGRKIKSGEEVLTVPTFGENIKYFFNYQLNFMYWRYFLWNFVGRQNDIQSHGDIVNGNWLSGIKFIDEIYLGPQDNLPKTLENNHGRNTYYFLPFILGLIGLFYQLKHDRNNFTVVMWLFFMTGIAIILYLNQPPLQPRERDYAFAGSFYAFAIWIGLGVAALANIISKKIGKEKIAVIVASVVSLSVPTILIAENWDDHDRSGRYIARDFGSNYLNSTLPNSIIMPYGDNDTFPLWYNQEVEGVRTDVKVANLSYLASDWYANQMTFKSNDSEPIALSLPKDIYYKHNEVIPVVEVIKTPITAKELFDFIKSKSKSKTDMLNQLFNGYYENFIPSKKIVIPVNKDNAIKSGIVKVEDAHLMEDSITLDISGRGLNRSGYLFIDMLSTADWNRPMYLSQYMSLDDMGIANIRDYLQLDGFAYRIVPIKTNSKSIDVGRIDTEYLYDKLMSQFSYGNVKDPKVNIDYFSDYTFSATQIRRTFARLAKQLIQEGDTTRAVKVLDKLLEEIPFNKIKHNYHSSAVIEAIYMTGNKDKAREILVDFKNNQLEYIDYLLQFKGDKAKSVQNEFGEMLVNLSKMYQIAKNNGEDDIAKELEQFASIMGGTV